MRARLISDRDCTGYASEFNIHAAVQMGEALFYCEQFGTDSVFCSALEVQLKNNSWVQLKEAIEQKIVVPNYYCSCFREAETDQEKQRGYYQ